MKRFLLFLAPALLLAGCAREPAPPGDPEAKGETPVLTADELRFLSMVGRDTKFDRENIDRIVGDVIGFMESTPTTRSAGGRSVAEIRPLAVTVPASSVSTRSGEETTETTETTEEELFYLVNFDDNQGYSIIAADHRIRDEIALFVGHGNLDETEVENPGLAVMLSRLDDYAARSIAEYEAWCDSVEVSMMARIAEDYAELAAEIAAYLASLEQGGAETRTDDLIPIDPDEEFVIVSSDYSYGPWTAIEQIGPMIPVEWGQSGGEWDWDSVAEIYTYVESPFNRSVEASLPASVITQARNTLDEYGRQGYIPAGCVAIATVQLMAYWKHPSGNYDYHGLTLNDDAWDDLCEWTGSRRNVSYKTWSGYMGNAPADVQQLCADLIWRIGEDIDMEYSQSGSGASSDDAIDLLEDFGYTVSSEQNYNYNAALASINAERPVLMSGYSHRTEHGIFGINLWYTYQNGHDWLIDGYLKHQQAVTVTYTWYPTSLLVQTRANVLVPQPYTTTETYNRHRDFFHNNFGWNGTDNGYYVPGIFDTSDDYNEELDSSTRSGEDKNYQYNLTMWTNIHN
jgi:hypothetical protein